MSRRKEEPAKYKVDMTPMIDCVFQLMIFFMLTLKIAAQEGNFDINMPLGRPSEDRSDPKPEVKVRLVANADGSLGNVQMGARSLGNGDRAFGILNSEVLKMIGRPGNPLTKDTEVEIDADYNLDYRYVMRAISACSGKMDAKGNLVRYVEKIKFAPPRKPTS